MLKTQGAHRLLICFNCFFQELTDAWQNLTCQHVDWCAGRSTDHITVGNAAEVHWSPWRSVFAGSCVAQDRQEQWARYHCAVGAGSLTCQHLDEGRLASTVGTNDSHAAVQRHCQAGSLHNLLGGVGVPAGVNDVCTLRLQRAGALPSCGNSDKCSRSTQGLHSCASHAKQTRSAFCVRRIATLGTLLHCFQGQPEGLLGRAAQLHSSREADASHLEDGLVLSLNAVQEAWLRELEAELSVLQGIVAARLRHPLHKLRQVALQGGAEADQHCSEVGARCSGGQEQQH